MSKIQRWKLESEDWPMDYWFVGLVAVLMVIGLTMVTSSSIAFSYKQHDTPYHFLIRQTFAMGLGVFVGWVALKIPLSIWEKQRGTIFVLGIILLVAVLIFGREINGSRRWLSLGFMNFQVAEFMKMAVVIFMAGYLNRHGQAVKESLTAVLRLALPFGMMAILLLLQPDFGSTVVIAVIITGMLLVAGAPWRYFAITVVPLATLLVIMVIIEPYRMARVTGFLDPWADPFGGGYQLTQALIAAGSGGWFGVGIGESVQKLLFLPDAHTDFVFSIYAEEFGLIGVVLLIILYLAICYRLFRIGRKAFIKSQFFGGLIAYGVGVWFILQAVISMGVNLGLFPTKGLTLPLMSYGGSSVLMMLMAFGLVLRVDYEIRKGIKPVSLRETQDKEAFA